MSHRKIIDYIHTFNSVLFKIDFVILYLLPCLHTFRVQRNVFPIFNKHNVFVYLYVYTNPKATRSYKKTNNSMNPEKMIEFDPRNSYSIIVFFLVTD